jgi:hypothetical protein
MDTLTDTGCRSASTLCSCQQPGLALAFARGDQVELGERRAELAGADPERGGGTDLTERGDRQQPAWCQALHDRPVKTAVPELVAEYDLEGWSLGQAVIEIDNVEPAATANPAPPGQIPSVADGHGRDVEPVNIQATTRQPHGAKPLPTCEIEGVPRSGEHVVEGREHAWRADRTDRRRSETRIPLVPADAVLLGHPRHLTKRNRRAAIPPTMVALDCAAAIP